MRPSIYLAGPITGLSYDNCTDWRDQAMTIFSGAGIDAYSPMRMKTYLLGEMNVGDSYEGTVMSSQRGIYARDYYDCRTKDALFVNLLGTRRDDENSRVSIGTVMEIAWATAYEKPIILVMEKEPGINLHNHAMLREACPLWVDTLQEGYKVAKSLLLPVPH